MIIRRSRYVSILLMALASSIAITEYVMYVPPLVPEGIDEELSPDSESEDISEQEASSQDNESELALDSAESNSDISGVLQSEQSEGNLSVDPFSPSGEKEVTISQGDTIASIVTALGFDKTDVYLASKSLSKVFNLRNLKIGQKITVKGKRDSSGDLALTGLELRIDSEKITVSRTSSGFEAERVEVPVKKVVRSVSGTMAPKSPAYSLKQCGLNSSVSSDALRGLSQVVNIRASKSPVDFEFLYQEFYDDEGRIVKKPELLYASVIVDGKITRVYKFRDGRSTEYVDSSGMILRTLASSRSMLAQPLNSMKVTSKFGIRKHPVTGKIKGHTGIDLSAKVGTPIRAAANGQVMRASHYSGYGRYVNIKHTGTISTAYGHLSRIVVRNGQHVRQGQIIGYTGNSGVSTGPHLHYEVLKHGRPINPMSFVKQEPQKLTGRKMSKFNQFKREINLQVVGLTPSKNKLAKVKKYS